MNVAGDRRAWLVVGLLGAAAVAVGVVRVLVGGSLAGLSEQAAAVVLDLRLVRVTTAVIVGAALGAAGVMLQSLLRNPLASPDLMGVSSGAGFAVMLSIYLAWRGTDLGIGLEGLGGLAGQAGDGLVAGGDGGGVVGGRGGRGGRGGGPDFSSATWHAGPALVGSMLVLGLLYVIGRGGRVGGGRSRGAGGGGVGGGGGGIEPTTLLLIGVVLALVLGSATTLVQQFMPNGQLGGARFVAGSLSDEVRWGQLAIAGPAVLLCVLGGVWLGPAMDAASLGDDEARSVGVNLAGLRVWLFVLSGVMTAAAVVIAGPLGFIGLVCPHAVRLLAGSGGAWPAHRPLVVGSALAGVVLVCGADVLVKVLEGPTGRLPLGVLTTLVGGPVFVLLLRSLRRGRLA